MSQVQFEGLLASAGHVQEDMASLKRGLVTGRAYGVPKGKLRVKPYSVPAHGDGEGGDESQHDEGDNVKSSSSSGASKLLDSLNVSRPQGFWGRGRGKRIPTTMCRQQQQQQQQQQQNPPEYRAPEVSYGPSQNLVMDEEADGSSGSDTVPFGF